MPFLMLPILLLLLLPTLSHAFPIAPTCDLRILQLNAAQKKSLQKMRQNHKKIRDNMQREWRNRDNGMITALLHKPVFDEQEAQKVAQERFRDDMALTVLELHFYHEFYHLLNPQQQATWQRFCVRPH